MKRLLSILSVMAVMCSCSESGDKLVPQAFPFKENKSDNWGLVCSNGKVLFADKFDNDITPVYNGVFFEITKDGYVIHYASDPDKTVAEVYSSIAHFTDDITPSFKKNEPIKYIDRKGNVKFELPMRYYIATSFQYGYSLAEDDLEKKFNLVDLKGNITSFEDFSVVEVLKNNRFIAYKVGSDIPEFHIIDKKGRIIYTMDNAISVTSDGNYYLYKDDNGMVGMKTVDGRTVVRAKYDNIYYAGDKYLAVNEDDKYGIINYEGETVLDKDYYGFSSGDGLFFSMKDKKDNYSIVDCNGESVIKDNYDEIVFFPGQEVFYATSGKNNSYLVSKSGKILADYSEIKVDYNTDYNGQAYYFGLGVVFDDCFDISCFVGDVLRLNRSSVDFGGYKGMSPKAAADNLTKSFNFNQVEHSAGLEWFPPVKKNIGRYGIVSLSLAFDKVAESYLVRDWFYSYTKHKFYDKGVCKGMKVVVPMDEGSSVGENYELIKKEFGNTLKEFGFSTVAQDNVMESSDMRISYSFGDELTLTIVEK